MSSQTRDERIDLLSRELSDLIAESPSAYDAEVDAAALVAAIGDGLERAKRSAAAARTFAFGIKLQSDAFDTLKGDRKIAELRAFLARLDSSSKDG